MEVDEVSIIETTPIETMRHCVIGVPDVGLVGLIAVNHIIHDLEMSEAGYLESEAFSPIMVVHKGDPKAPFRLYSREGLVALTSEVPIHASVISPLARSVVSWVKARDIKLLVSVSGIAVPNRLDIENPAVYGVASSSSEKVLLRETGIQLLEEGFMVGPHALILRECLKEKIPNVVLLAQSHYQYPDPGAAASMIAALNKLLGLDVKVVRLLEQAEEIRLKTRELMQRTQRSMRGMQKAQEQEIPAMYA